MCNFCNLTANKGKYFGLFSYFVRDYTGKKDENKFWEILPNSTSNDFFMGFLFQIYTIVVSQYDTTYTSIQMKSMGFVFRLEDCDDFYFLFFIDFKENYFIWLCYMHMYV